MLEYGQAVGQAGQTAHGSSPSTGSTDVGASIVANLTAAVNQASAATGVPPALLVVVAIVVVLFIGWFVFLR
jgi:cobalamin biosynthesis Mg chelatase CobN